jgi:hypothetical protein
MVNASTIVSGEMGSKLLCSKVDEEVVIPGVIQGDVEEVLVGKIHINGCIISVRGKCHDDLDENEFFISFGSIKF